MKRIISLALILVVLASILAGCGDAASKTPAGHYVLKEYQGLNVQEEPNWNDDLAYIDVREDGTYTLVLDTQSGEGKWEEYGGSLKFTMNGVTDIVLWNQKQNELWFKLDGNGDDDWAIYVKK